MFVPRRDGRHSTVQLWAAVRNSVREGEGCRYDPHQREARASVPLRIHTLPETTKLVLIKEFEKGPPSAAVVAKDNRC